jgi:hypothetical protein
MARNMTIAQQIEAAREMLNQTQAGKIRWGKTTDSQVFTSVRPNAVAVLDRIGQPPLVRLRFSVVNGHDDDAIIGQLPADAQQPPQARELDKILLKIWQEAGLQAGYRQNAADLFLGQPDT